MLARFAVSALPSGRAFSLFACRGRNPAAARFASFKTGGYRHGRIRTSKKLIAYCALPIAILTVVYLDDQEDRSEKTSLDALVPSFAHQFWSGYWPGGKTEPNTKDNSPEHPALNNNPHANMPIQPGRPETLTPEQEIKLKEFWAAVLHVFGVDTSSAAKSESTDASLASATSTPAANSDASSIASSTKEKKEKEAKKSTGGLRGFLGRGKKEKSEPASGSSTPTTTSEAPASAVDTVSAALKADGEDKHGQNKAFKAALADLSPEELRTAFWDMVKHDNPDGLLLRFLRARKWDIEKALVMMVSTMHWRLKEMNVEELTKKGELAAFEDPNGDDFYQQVKLGKSFVHGVDKEGRTICYVRARLHRAGEQTEESLERYTVYIMETARLMLKPPVDTAAVVFDLTGFSLANMDYAPVKYLIKCFEAHYPESLGVCLVHKAPWVFQGIWSIIKGWLDPVVASKIHFTRSAEELAEFIAKENIPKELGGDEDWEYSPSQPVPGENDAQKDTETLAKLKVERRKIVEEYEALTKAWIAEKVEAESASCTATPTQNGSSTETPKTNLTETLKKRNALAEQLKTGYWAMDKYLRAKTIYDRAGVIKEGGIIDDFAYRNTTKVADTIETTPAPAPGPAASAVAAEKAAEKTADAAPPKKAEEWDVD